MAATIRTRFAPSPTGTLHVGSVRTALFAWLHARHNKGCYLLRVEDTDRERSTPENVDAIFDGLGWLGIDSDEEPVFQSQRSARYAGVIASWLDSGKAYRCYCSRDELAEMRAMQLEAGLKQRYDGRCRERTDVPKNSDFVVRFKNPVDGVVTVNDLVRGQVTFSNSELDDLVIARSDGSPTYNFTVVVDDSDMGITHVIRGDDHLNNTPRQMNMIDALGVQPPAYAHLPMILGADGAKLSKRHGAMDVREYRESGYLPEALLNYLVRLGWSHGDKEIFSVDEMIGLFDIADVNQSASAFNAEKLTWLNQQYIIAMPSDELGARLTPFLTRVGLDIANGPDPAMVADAFRERAETLVKMAESCRYCYEDFAEIDPGAAKKHLRPAILQPLKAITEQLRSLTQWSAPVIAAAISSCADAHNIKMGKLGQPLRVAVTGGPVSPPIDATLVLIGRKRSVSRLENAIELIEVRQKNSQ